MATKTTCDVCQRVIQEVNNAPFVFEANISAHLPFWAAGIYKMQVKQGTLTKDICRGCAETALLKGLRDFIERLDP